MVREIYRTRRGHDEISEWCDERLSAWAVPHVRHEIESMRGRVHLTIAGDGNVTVVYLPGTNFNAATSLSLATGLVASAKVVLVDLPGQPGLSDDARRRPPLPEDGAWVDQLLASVAEIVAHRPIVLVGHSLGAAVALAAGTSGVAALVLVNPAGLTRLRVTAPVAGSTVRWLLRPSERSSALLLAQMSAPGLVPEPALASWMTLVGRHTRPGLAPKPLAGTIVERWRRTPRVVLSGRYDCFLPPARLAPAVGDRLGVDLTELPSAGHLIGDAGPVVTAIADIAARATPR